MFSVVPKNRVLTEHQAVPSIYVIAGPNGAGTWLAKSRQAGYVIHLLFQLYRPICDKWIFVDNAEHLPKVLARGGRDYPTAANDVLYEQIEEQYGSA